MIKPGQKLAEGDYNLLSPDKPNQQCKEILEACNMNNRGTVSFVIIGTVVYFGKRTLSNHEKCVKEHTFPDFKQLCENTFGV